MPECRLRHVGRFALSVMDLHSAHSTNPGNKNLQLVGEMFIWDTRRASHRQQQIFR